MDYKEASNVVYGWETKCFQSVFLCQIMMKFILYSVPVYRSGTKCLPEHLHPQIYYMLTFCSPAEKKNKLDTLCFTKTIMPPKFYSKQNVLDIFYYVRLRENGVSSRISQQVKGDEGRLRKSVNNEIVTHRTL